MRAARAIAVVVSTLVVLGALAGCGGGKSASARAPSPCRSGDPLANVYHPYRLKLLEACVTVSGTVRVSSHEVDGDVHFGLEVDTPYRHLLTPANHGGELVAEIVPADQPGCTLGRAPKAAKGTFNYGICTGADEQTPPVGSHVFVTGPYVLDENHDGWAEIHPVWTISSAPEQPLAAPGATRRDGSG